MKPYPYQERSIEFLKERDRVLLSHEPGLGKTLIAILAAELPVLVVCPASVMIHWAEEVARWRPGTEGFFTVVSYADRKTMIDPRDYRTLIVDECHYLKSPTSQRSLRVCTLVREIPRTFALSGTPVPNRPIELWPLLYSMEITDMSYEAFAFRYAAAYWNHWHELDVRGASNLPELRELIRPHMIRFEKAQVLPDLPEKTWRVLALDLPTPIQEKGFTIDELGKVPLDVAFEAMAEVLHEHGRRKVKRAADHIRTLLDSMEKVVVFARHLDVIEALQEELKEFGAIPLIGAMTPKQRQVVVKAFARPDGPRVFIGQIQAAGTGTDGLQGACSHVVFAEADWVPAVLEQAADRVHRIGVKGNVTVDLLTVSGSIDEYMLRRALEKQEVIEQVYGDDRSRKGRFVSKAPSGKGESGSGSLSEASSREEENGNAEVEGQEPGKIQSCSGASLRQKQGRHQHQEEGDSAKVSRATAPLVGSLPCQEGRASLLHQRRRHLNSQNMSRIGDPVRQGNHDGSNAGQADSVSRIHPRKCTGDFSQGEPDQAERHPRRCGKRGSVASSGTRSELNTLLSPGDGLDPCIPSHGLHRKDRKDAPEGETVRAPTLPEGQADLRVRRKPQDAGRPEELLPPLREAGPEEEEAGARTPGEIMTIAEEIKKVSAKVDEVTTDLETILAGLDDEPEKKPAKKSRKKKEPEVTIDQVKEVFGTLIDESGTKGALKVLKPFKVTMVRDLDPDQYADAVKAAEEHMADDD